MDDLKQRLDKIRDWVNKCGAKEEAEAMEYLIEVLFPYWEEMEDSVEELIGRMRMIDDELSDRITKNLGRKMISMETRTVQL